MIARNDPCWCGSQKKWKKCHYPDKKPNDFSSLKDKYFKNYGIILKTPSEIDKIRKACKLSAEICKTLCDIAKEGITTKEIDLLSKQLHKKAKATPAAYHYGSPPFPGTICTSVNDVICHGIPDNTPLKNGDIINIDVASILDGVYGDTSQMVCIGQVDEESKRVVDTAYICMMNAIERCKPNALLSEIGDAIEDHAEKNNCSVVNQFVGHGVGLKFHEPPQVIFIRNKLNIPLVPGMTFTIEPMINAGKQEGYIDKENGWTARTIDHKPSAQWEHTILITESGHEILTQL
jgi:methionyl aminopeptidase